MLITQISSELAKSHYVKTTAYNSLNLIKFHNPFTIIKLRELEEKYNIKCIDTSENRQIIFNQLLDEVKYELNI